MRAGADGWIAELTRIASEQPFTGFVFWPEHQSVDQARRFAEEVVPALKANLAWFGPDPVVALAGRRATTDAPDKA